MRVGSNAWSAQFHVELEEDTIDNWGAVPEYAQALEASLGAGALERMKGAAAEEMEGFAANSRKLYENFMRQVR